MPEKNLNSLRTGMKFSNPQDLKDTEFSLLVNGQIESVNGSFLKVSNAHSNILCNRLNGYKVLGQYYLPSQSLTFYFLVDPLHHKSEIGFIKDQVNRDKKDSQVHCSDCNNPIIEDTPLEQQEQVESCIYTTFVNADCLNFNINYPISSWIKVDDCNIRIYFTDDLNNPRYIDYNDFQKVTIDNCPLLESDELDCDKIKIFPETCYPEVVVTDVVSGGQNTSGVYQFTACYSDVRSNRVTDCFYVSNPTPLFNNPITIDEEYPMSKSIKLRVSNLNKDFKYFNLYVIKTIKGVRTPYLIETFEINSDNFSYIYTGINKNINQNVSIDEILSRRPHYTKAKSISESNGYLLLSSLSENRILNLQPVINKLPLYWQSVILNEGDYENPIIATNTVSYLADEVYTYAIEFTKADGTRTNRFHIPGRHFTDYDNEIINNDDVIEVNGCEIDPRNKRWQVYNTASILGSSTILSTPVQQSVQYDCTSTNFQIEVIWTKDPLFPDDPTKETFTQIFRREDGTVLTEQEVVDDLCLCTNPYIDDVNMLHQSTPPIKISPTLTSDLNLFVGKDSANIPILNPNSPFTLISLEGTVSVNHYDNNIYLGQKLPLPPKNYNGSVPPCLAKDCDYEDENGDIQTLYGWLSTKDNYNCANATTLPQAVKERCQLDTWGSFVPNQQALTPGDYASHQTQVIGVLPSGYSAGALINDSNQSWYSFTATTPVVAIEINTTNKVTIEVWKGICPPVNTGVLTSYTYGSPGFPSNLVYFNSVAPLNGIFLLSKDTTNNNQDLQVGETYYVKVYSDVQPPTCPDETCILCTLPNPDCYFRICINTPTPTSSEQVYKDNVVYLNCLYQLDYEMYKILDNYCNVQNYQYGLMSYWESEERYPCNEEVYGELAGQKIRHHKFPDFSIAPYFEKSDYSPDLTPNTNKIFPKGVMVSVQDIKQLLLEAETSGLITTEERLSICGYRILRGNRRGNESIIAKGLMTDVWEYRDNVYNTGKKIMFPNFPFNDNRENPLVQTKKIKTKNDVDPSFNLKHPYQGLKNYKYTFHSPNTSFNNPALGTEVKIECEQTGISIGSYQMLKNNTNYQYIGAGVISASIGFASVEAAFEGIQTVLNATLTISVTVFGSGTFIPLGLILAIIYENILSPIRMYSYYADWLEIIRKFAPFKNYAMYYIAQGNYDAWSKDDTGKSTVTEGNIRRAIGNTQYAKDGILNVKTETGYQKLNNFQRESSVFIETKKSGNSNKFFNSTVTEDNSRWIPDNCKSTARSTNISSYYAAIKNLLLDQYGQIDNIEYIDTGYNGRIEWNNDFQDTTADTIFGGDTYINRLSFKKKAPLFLDDRVYPSDSITVPADNLDINLSEIPNIAYPVYFMNYPTALDYSDGAQQLFGDVAVQSDYRMDFNFLCYSASGTAWAKTGLAAAILGGVSAGSAGIFSLPITVATISQSVKNNLGNDVYLSGKYIHSMYGISSFLVESNYNLDYRYGENNKAKDFYPHVGDIIEWTQQTHVPISEDNYYFYNKDYSKQNTENLGTILNNDFKQSKEDCKVSHPNRTINSLQDNDQNDRFDGNLIFLANNYNEAPKSAGKLKLVKGLDNSRILILQENGYSIANSYISQESNIAQSTVGTNTLFNKAIPVQYLKTDLGFGGTQTSAYVATEFGSFWMDNVRGHILNLTDNVQNIVQPEDQWWFKENLPFKILQDFPEVDIDNNYKYFGNCIVYDARFKKIIFTKRDAQLKEEWRGFVEYQGDLFYDKVNNKHILPTDETYFCNKSFTISYSPLIKQFISFHSFTPNYYSPNQNYFSSGINYSTTQDDSENGLWNHNLTNKSFQVYYGKLYPYIQEYSIASKAQNKVLNNVESITEFRRFQDNLSSAMVLGKFFNKALIYNQNQTTGLLELINKDKNNLFQVTQYPKQKPNSREILTENIENIYRFNDFYNVAIHQNGQPIMTYPCNQPYSELNPEAISYKAQYLKDLMRSDYFQIRLINDKYSNYQILSRYNFSQTTNSPS